MTECYRCGQEGHTRQDCPAEPPLPAAAPASGQAAVPPRVVRDPAIAAYYAAVIRNMLGYPPKETP